ncbi:glutaminyl-peptide cyclotransferase [Eurytemora carolleeae]|uniref:glutaminyl-peptide cyclotransferase n=1 Tax=Eurytemora carolleeae TaxID=1294199 RepID=UPI000C77BDFB|nr:glutaminyl-peptide cyclotransferase [Eurytemora carolleeae]|eukprot:XP_023327071.1 glutaminyl-peptide cyclotransferase-like [Eurytemora affinis]
MKSVYITIFSLLCFAANTEEKGPKKECWNEKKDLHSEKKLNSRVISGIISGFEYTSTENFKPLLDPLLITRVPETTGSKKARQHITDTLEKLGWSIELEKSTQSTVVGERTFVNIIATYNPRSPRRLVLAAHYDSKLTPEGFLGATDSAVPCAMLLGLALDLDPYFKKIEGTPELTVQLIFFDGEEAYVSWTSTDSLYGSRNLASKWNSEPYTVDSKLGYCQAGSAVELDRIDSFVLLDLIGTKNPRFLKYADFEEDLFNWMEAVEEKVLLVSGCDVSPVMKGDKSVSSGIEDDHLPFFKLGVRRILHLIANPFPSVWHTIDDNESSLDYPTIFHIQRILNIFTMQYLEL